MMACGPSGTALVQQLPMHAGWLLATLQLIAEFHDCLACSPLPQVCNKVPVPKTKQVCNRICTKTTTTTEQMTTEPTVMSSGKGGQVVVSTGKGRKMLGTESADMLPLVAAGHLAGKALVAKAAGAFIGAKAVAGAAAVSHSGKGGVVMQAPQEDVQCNDVSAARHGDSVGSSSTDSSAGW